MRTPQQIWDYYVKNLQQDDMFHFIIDVLIPYMPYDVCKSMLKDDTTKEEWGEIPSIEEQTIISEMEGYMDFAWGKVQDHRGISASRSVQHYQAWLLMLGDDEMLAFALNDANYPMYGAPILAKICEKYGFPIPMDNLLANMIKGQPCHTYCQDGCI